MVLNKVYSRWLNRDCCAVWLKHPIAIFFLLVTSTTVDAQALNTLKIESVADLKEFFRYTPDRIPIVCGHRGGATLNFPENCIATFENTLRHTPAFFELDPRLTKDSVVVVMHDATLDRTTNGTGKISDYTWKELKRLRLRDPAGNITRYRISRLSEMLQWARGKTILMLDKKDVPLPLLLKEITDNQAESYVLVSAYTPDEALFYYRRNQDIMFEAFILDMERFEAFAKTGIPWSNIVAYLSKTVDPELYDTLHERNVMCINYTAKAWERLEDKDERIAAYRKLVLEGADILLSDKVLEVADAIRDLRPANSRKERFFDQTKTTD